MLEQLAVLCEGVVGLKGGQIASYLLLCLNTGHR